MARPFAIDFYHSQAWQRTRDSYMRAQRGLCEKCMSRGVLKPAEIVHHKVHLSPENINDPYVTLSFDNLEALCRTCHAEEHPEIYGSELGFREPRVQFDEYGDVIYAKEDYSGG